MYIAAMCACANGASRKWVDTAFTAGAVQLDVNDMLARVIAFMLARVIALCISTISCAKGNHMQVQAPHQEDAAGKACQK